jgi:hypothetical protein
MNPSGFVCLTSFPSESKADTREREDYSLAPLGCDPWGRSLQNLNEPFGFCLFNLISFRKQAFTREREDYSLAPLGCDPGGEIPAKLK